MKQNRKSKKQVGCLNALFMPKAAIIMTKAPKTPCGSTVCQELAIKWPNTFLYAATSTSKIKMQNTKGHPFKIQKHRAKTTGQSERVPSALLQSENTRGVVG